MVFNLRGELETLDNNKLKQMTSSISAHRLPDQLRETSPGEEKHRRTVWNRKSYKQIKSPVSVEIWMKGTVVYSNSLWLKGADNWTLNRAIEETRKRPTLRYWLIRWSVTPNYKGMFRFIKILELNKKWKKLKRSYGVLDIVLGPRSRHLYCHILHVCYSVLTGQKTSWSPLNSFDYKVSNHVM